MKTVLVAGATGAVGSALVPMLRAEGFRALPHVRPKTAERHPLGRDPEALVFELADAARLDAAMRGADAVVCSVGTMRVRFRAGDTYESSDYRPVVELVESAQRSGRRPQFVLVSALGARRGGGYLGWKHKAEEVVRASGLPNAILRPSFLDSTHAGSQPSDGKARKPPPIVSGALRLLGAIPPLHGISDDLRPIPVEVLCAAIVRILRDGAPAGLLHGRELWALSPPPASAVAPSAPRRS
jgi:uncharacterized protein YbjT (DUF2867 family)